ncbi:MAG: DUF4445 domain-containing protein [Bacilli bacterium]|nr:DUF4445 domain-containing protein [Bacilli bacterium]
MKIKKNNNILQALQTSNIDIIAPCNGRGICGKCKIIIPSKPRVNLTEEKFLTSLEIQKGVRLACTRTVLEDTEVESYMDSSTMKIDSDVCIHYDMNPYLKIKNNGLLFDVFRSNVFIETKKTNNAYGIAIDIGTTTVVLVLLDLYRKKIVETISFINPQSRYGSDVISRIQFASTKENIDLLSSLMTNRVHTSILSLLKENKISKKDLYEVVIAANTTMNYLLLKLDPSPLAVAPYHASFLETIKKEYSDIFSPDISATVTIIGGFDSFVGGDILSGIYSEALHQKSACNLFVDLGTNGEIVVVNNGKIYGTSTAAGPAFEGVNISCGIGSIAGAISKFTDKNTYETINDKPPIGICGSGLIDIVGYLLKENIISKSGLLKEEYFIHGDISISKKDIREIQLAKSAIRSGIEFLLNETGIMITEIDHLYLAGGFGKHINLDNMFELGILPPSLKNKVIVIGNSSLSGAVKYLFQPLSNELKQLRQNCTIINLATSSSYQELFIKYLSF